MQTCRSRKCKLGRLLSHRMRMQVCAELANVRGCFFDLRLPAAGLLATKCTSEEVQCMGRCLPPALLAAPELAPLIPVLTGGLPRWVSWDMHALPQVCMQDVCSALVNLVA